MVLGYSRPKRNPQRGIFCVRKFTRTSDKRCFFGYSRPNRSPKRGPNGVRLDSGLDHVVQTEVQMDSIWTSFWTTTGPFGPRVVQMDRAWSKRSPNGPYVVQIGPVVVQSGVQAGSVWTSFWTTCFKHFPNVTRFQQQTNGTR